jgi:hypothetical protein
MEYEMDGHVVRMGEVREPFKIFVGKPEGKSTRKTKA